MSDVTRNIEEQLSAFLDGELAEEELSLLVRRLERDDSLRGTLARYATVGSVLRRDPVSDAALRFRHGVMAAIENEEETVAEPVEAVGSGRTRVVFAAAAAVIAVLGGVLLTGVDGQRPGAGAQPVAAAGDRIIDEAGMVRVAETSETGTIDRVGPAARTAIASEDGAPRTQRRMRLGRERLTSYMISHGEYSRGFPAALADSRVFIQQASFEE